jgi:hypothetical protein
MSKYIILTIYSSAICLVLTLLNSVSMLPDYSEAADVVFDMSPALSIPCEVMPKGHERADYVIKSQHLTCQHTRAGDLIHHQRLKPDVRTVSGVYRRSFLR